MEEMSENGAGEYCFESCHFHVNYKYLSRFSKVITVGKV